MSKTDYYEVDVEPGSYRSNLDFDAIEKRLMEKLDLMSKASTNLAVAKEMLSNAQADSQRALDKTPLTDDEYKDILASEFRLSSRLGVPDPQQVNSNVRARISAIQGKHAFDLAISKNAVSAAKIARAIATLDGSATAKIILDAAVDIAGEYLDIVGSGEKEAFSHSDAIRIHKDIVKDYQTAANTAAKSFTSELATLLGKVSFGILFHQAQNGISDLGERDDANPLERNALYEHKGTFEWAGEKAINRLYEYAKNSPVHIKTIISQQFSKYYQHRSEQPGKTDGLRLPKMAGWLRELGTPWLKVSEVFQNASAKSPEKLKQEVIQTLNVARAASLDVEIPHRLVDMISKRCRNPERMGTHTTALFPHGRFIDTVSGKSPSFSPTRQVVNADIAQIDEELHLCEFILTREALSHPERKDQLDQLKTFIAEFRGDLKQITDVDSVNFEMRMAATPADFSDLRKCILRDVKAQQDDRIAAKVCEMQSSRFDPGLTGTLSDGDRLPITRSPGPR